MKKTYFNIDDIQSIELYDKKESKWKWLEERPKKQIFLGLITTQTYKPKGYYYFNHYEENEYNNYFSLYEKNENELKNRFGYLIEDKKVYIHPFIIINLKNGCIREQFNSFEEAESFIQSIVKKSNKIFEVITHKN